MENQEPEFKFVILDDDLTLTELSMDEMVAKIKKYAFNIIQSEYQFIPITEKFLDNVANITIENIITGSFTLDTNYDDEELTRVVKTTSKDIINTIEAECSSKQFDSETCNLIKKYGDLKNKCSKYLVDHDNKIDNEQSRSYVNEASKNNFKKYEEIIKAKQAANKTLLGEYRDDVIKSGNFHPEQFVSEVMANEPKDIWDTHTPYFDITPDEQIDEHECKCCGKCNKHQEKTSNNIHGFNEDDLYYKVLNMAASIYEKKNHDYSTNGKSAFDTSWDMMGEKALWLRLNDKFQRFTSLVFNGDAQVKDEKIEDTLMDMLNYIALGLKRLM